MRYYHQAISACCSVTEDKTGCKETHKQTATEGGATVKKQISEYMQ